MVFTETRLAGAHVIDLQPMADERGFFARTFCQREFSERGLDATFVQCNLSGSTRRGTLRGLHYQLPPRAEAKLVRCVRGAMYDVIVDLRPESTTFLQWVGVELTAESGRALFVPRGFAHGFETLGDDTEILYQMSEFHAPEAARGIRWNDPLLGITWPEDVRCISARDGAYPDLRPPELIDELKSAGGAHAVLADGT
jgi:dTDP-4-dehydrorhamnose 3,5-epimerase